MTRLLRIIAFALIPALLCSCGDGALIQTESIPEITQQIYVVPERYNDEPYTFGYQPHPIYLEAERTVKFCATYIVDDHYLPTIIYDDYITEKIWDIDGNYFNLNSVRYSFSEPGHKVVTLKSIDKMNDTISEVLDVYVNTPISATLESPKDGFNMADPVSEDGVELSWKVSGTDEWETSYCTIFASYNKNTVWQNPLARGGCNEPATILGPLAEDIPEDSSVTIYWGVVATNYAKNSFSESDTTDIFHFSTKYKGADSADLVIPISYDGFWGVDSTSMRITLLNSMGDTLATHVGSHMDSPVIMKVLPQTDIRILAEESFKQEYKAEPITIDIMAPSRYELDTLFFTDSISPFVEPGSDRFEESDKIIFYAFDNGSGINENRITVTSGGDTLTHYYDSHKIYFSHPPFIDYCFIKVVVQDNAKNVSANVFWKLQRRGAEIIVTGPFDKEGGY